ncbi:phosphate uptake regulator PhoU [Halovenus sp. WSH3]|uniref:Phosphate uptake regulator PhoU n=1 Tax=Halovenus carboxidivorans TaxID=2692199 RepID=A0A6B0T8B9_9EURY|nr:phosphate uptake regulator PhoU [Halovenus carboxidivorans]MXR52466.1 phosphate uptake regulator PhoU [Halovenus carboxidivorans]
METRKIQSVGGGTYTVSISKEWADAQGITTGDTVELHRHIDGIFAIQAPERERTAPSRITIHLTQAETDTIERTIRAAYAAGTKRLELENPETFTAEQQETLRRVTRQLTGVSIVEDSERAVTVKTMLDTDEISVRQSVRQLRFVVLSLHRDATASLAGGRAPAELAERDDQADRLDAMITRSFARAIRRLDEVDALGVTRPELFDLWQTTRELERVGDHADGIATAAEALGGDLDQGCLDTLETHAETARDIVSDAVSVIIGDAGAETAHRALILRDDLCADIDASDGGPDLLAHRIRRTAEHGGNIAEIALQRAARTGNLQDLSS